MAEKEGKNVSVAREKYNCPLGRLPRVQEKPSSHAPKEKPSKSTVKSNVKTIQPLRLRELTAEQVTMIPCSSTHYRTGGTYGIAVTSIAQRPYLDYWASPTLLKKPAQSLPISSQRPYPQSPHRDLTRRVFSELITRIAFLGGTKGQISHVRALQGHVTRQPSTDANCLIVHWFVF